VTQVNLPNRNITGDNLWSQVEDNDDAIADVVNGGLDNGNIAAAADINASKLLDGSVSAAKLGTDSVTNVKINASAVDTAEIADDAVTSPKLNLTITSDSANSETSATSSAANVADLSVSLSAGTYLLIAQVQVQISNNATGAVWLYNQTTSTDVGDKPTIQRDGSTIVRRFVTLVSPLTLTTTGTIGVRFGPDSASAVSLTVPGSAASIVAIRIG
jgi:hypothetical protein